MCFIRSTCTKLTSVVTFHFSKKLTSVVTFHFSNLDKGMYFKFEMEETLDPPFRSAILI